MLRTLTFFLLLIGSVYGKTICLNMIVKDESPVIERCLNSVKGIIDYWVIVDTGSTDGTQQLIQKCLKGIPGELHESPWINFAHNRNEALNIAKGKADYILFIDADEKLQISKTFSKEALFKDCYRVPVQGADEGKSFTFHRAGLINSRLNWVWKGVLHEELIRPPEARTFEEFQELMIFANTEDGHRCHDPQKHHRDAATLEKGLEKEPGNSRYVFYLALSYENAKEYELALKNYEKRASMGGWDQEVYQALYCSAKLKELLHKSPEAIIEAYSKAYSFRPSRAEPLYHLARHYAKAKNYGLAYVVSTFALSIPVSRDLMPIEQWIYEYGLLFEAAKNAYEIGKYEEAKTAYEKLLLKQNLPKEIQETAKMALISIKFKLAF